MSKEIGNGPWDKNYQPSGISRAEERAQAYEDGLDYYHYTGDNPSVAYKAGYEQAEKDLALTPDDIKLITKIHYEIVFKDTTGIKVGDVASEVLKRFLEAKK